MASIRTRVTRDTFPLSVFVTFGEIQTTPLGLREQVLRALHVADLEVELVLDRKAIRSDMREKPLALLRLHGCAKFVLKKIEQHRIVRTTVIDRTL